MKDVGINISRVVTTVESAVQSIVSSMSVLNYIQPVLSKDISRLLNSFTDYSMNCLGDLSAKVSVAMKFNKPFDTVADHLIAAIAHYNSLQATDTQFDSGRIIKALENAADDFSAEIHQQSFNPKNADTLKILQKVASTIDNTYCKDKRKNTRRAFAKIKSIGASLELKIAEKSKTKVSFSASAEVNITYPKAKGLRQLMFTPEDIKKNFNAIQTMSNPQDVLDHLDNFDKEIDQIINCKPNNTAFDTKNVMKSARQAKALAREDALIHFCQQNQPKIQYLSHHLRVGVNEFKSGVQ